MPPSMSLNYTNLIKMSITFSELLQLRINGTEVLKPHRGTKPEKSRQTEDKFFLSTRPPCPKSGHALTRMRQIFKSALPSCRPFSVFFVSLNTVMKSSFILVTNWYFDFYKVAKFGHQGGRRIANVSSGSPGLVCGDGLFVNHISNQASAMPTPSLIFYGR